MHPYPPVLESEISGGYTYVQSGISSSYSRSARLIFNGEMDVDACDDFGRTTLMNAAKNGCSCEVMMLIVDHNADINCIDSDNYSALMYAMKNTRVEGWKEIVTCLLRTDGICLTQKGNDGETASSLFKNNDTVSDKFRDFVNNRLLQAKRRNGDTDSSAASNIIDVDADDSLGRTDLMNAAKNGDSIEARSLILEHKADINCIDSHGYSALMYALKNTCIESESNHHMEAWKPIVVCLLKQDGICLNQEGKNGETALSLFENNHKLKLYAGLRGEIKNFLMVAACLNGDTESADKIKKMA